MVSPMPWESSAPKATADLIVPWKAGPASGTPGCSGWAPWGGSWRCASPMTTGSLCLTEILMSRKSCSSKREASHRADSASASGVALPYFWSRRRSSDPALTPIRIGVPWSFAARAISLTLSSNCLMLPGLTRTAAQPASLAAKTYLGWKWMSAITGICDLRAMVARASASSCVGQATRTIWQPDAVSSAICWSVAPMSEVRVVVIDCTDTGAPPPTATGPTWICRDSRRSAIGRTGTSGTPKEMAVMALLAVSGDRLAHGAQRLLERAHGGENGGGLVAAVRHAVGAARVLAAAVLVPVGLLDEFAVRRHVSVAHQVAGPLPAEQRVGRERPA